VPGDLNSDCQRDSETGGRMTGIVLKQTRIALSCVQPKPPNCCRIDSRHPEASGRKIPRQQGAGLR